MFGEINAWFYKGLGGIKPDRENPGFKNVILEPHFVNGLDTFEVKHNGPFGEIVSGWEKSEGKIIYHVKIPPNSTATVYLDAKAITQNGKTVTGKSSDNKDNTQNRHFILKLKSGNFEFIIEK